MPERNESGARGMVIDIMRGSVHDGPGIRTTVFLKGCPLRCVWCHNPESQSGEKELWFNSSKCTLCRRCEGACSQNTHSFDAEGKHRIDREKCRVCGSCAALCPGEALEIKGACMTATDVVREAAADKAFYEATGGGLTVSGGEPFAQTAFTMDILKKAKAAGISTAVETCGFTAVSVLRAAAGFTDLFLYDCKGIDCGKHKANTGVSNGAILKNLRELCRMGASVIMRCPLIPGLNDSDNDLRALAAFRKELGTELKGMQIMPYHHMGNAKAERTGRPIPFDHPDASEDEKQRWLSALHEYGAADAELA